MAGFGVPPLSGIGGFPGEVPPGGGFGGIGGFPGVGGGAGLNLDVGGGFGLPGAGLLGGIPGWSGWNGPYIPSTPLGALGGIKGDLIVPIVVVGVALFLLLLIVLVVKAALAWKLSLLADLADGPKKWRRDAGTAAAPQLDDDRMIELARVVMSAIYSESCTRRMLCEIGSYARETKELTSLLRVVEPMVPSDYIPSVEIIRSSAEGSFECAKQFPCGDANIQGQPGKNSTQQPQPAQPIGIQIQNATETNEIRPSKPTKFRRAIPMKKM